MEMTMETNDPKHCQKCRTCGKAVDLDQSCQIVWRGCSFSVVCLPCAELQAPAAAEPTS
jgi:hypothetical protein